MSWRSCARPYRDSPFPVVRQVIETELGAPLDAISMAVVCGYCNAKVSGGAFDWVLSRIEQDESYSG